MLHHETMVINFEKNNGLLFYGLFKVKNAGRSYPVTKSYVPVQPEASVPPLSEDVYPSGHLVQDCVV